MSGKVRVYNLARELGLSSKELLDLLREEGLEVKSHSSTIEDEYAELIREHVLAERRAREEQLKKFPAEMAAAAEAVAEEAREGTEEEEELVGESGRPILHLKPPVVVRDLAEALGLKPNVLIAELMGMNVFAAINQVIEPEIVKTICERRGSPSAGGRFSRACGPWQDHVAGPHPADQRRRRRSGRHHSAYRGERSALGGQADHVHRYAGP